MDDHRDCQAGYLDSQDGPRCAAGWCLYEKPTDLKGDECEDRPGTHAPGAARNVQDDTFGAMESPLVPWRCSSDSHLQIATNLVIHSNGLSTIGVFPALKRRLSRICLLPCLITQRVHGFNKQSIAAYLIS